MKIKMTYKIPQKARQFVAHAANFIFIVCKLSATCNVSFSHIVLDSQEPQTNDDEDVEVNVTEAESESCAINLPIIKVEDYDSESNLGETNNEKKIEQDDGNDERRPTKDEKLKQICSEDPGIQETLADIAQSFTSKLDSIRSSFTMSLDRNVASCLGKK